MKVPPHAPSIPARERILPLLGDAGPKLPKVLFDVRIGRGTVASEFDRAVRVRFEGDGPASSRKILPETTTTQRLLDSPAGPAFERLVRSTLAVADGAEGRDNLRTLTFVPDEHAAKAVRALGYVAELARRSEHEVVRFTDSATGASKAERREARKFVLDEAADVPSLVRFSAGWNAEGELLITPDVSRQLFTGIGAYRPRTGDPILDMSRGWREAELVDNVNTLVHEAHHSVTPAQHPESAAARAFEESIATVLGDRGASNTLRASGIDVEQVVGDPRAATDRARLGWGPWNRDHLPEPPRERVATQQAHYFDGPRVVRDLLKLLDVDLRTNAGLERAHDLLQGRAVNHVPRRLADALIEHYDVKPAHRERLVDLVRASVLHPDGSSHVARGLRELGIDVPRR